MPLLPALTADHFANLKGAGFTACSKLSELNVGNCKGKISLTIPAPLRNAGYNGALIVKNHRERFKYIGLTAEVREGELHITDMPSTFFPGLILHERKLYRVSANDIVKGGFSLDKETSIDTWV